MGAALCHHCEVAGDQGVEDSSWRCHPGSKSPRDGGSPHGVWDVIAHIRHKQHKQRGLRSSSDSHRGDLHLKRHKHLFGSDRGLGGRARGEKVIFKCEFQLHYRIALYVSFPRGQYATVALATDLRTSRSVAVKVISKKKLSHNPGSHRENVEVEIKALRALIGQPNIVQFIDAFQDPDLFFIVMEFLEGGTLLDYVKAAGHLKEEKIANFLFQMLNSINVCHMKGIAHRDLKFENFMFSRMGDEQSLKLVDFGSAAFFNIGELNPLKEFVGTLVYMAPEVIREAHYGTSSDIWSLGVIVYVMFCGQFPFFANNEDVKELIINKPVEFSSADWLNVSDGLKDLLQKMLDKDPLHRILIFKILWHLWMLKHLHTNTSFEFNQHNSSNESSNRGRRRDSLMSFESFKMLSLTQSRETYVEVGGITASWKYGSHL